jgi:ketosteroid isomerase-like protein
MKGIYFKMVVAGLGLALLTLVACGGSREPNTRALLSVIEVESMNAEFERAANAHIEAWNTHDLEVIRSVYTDDIVHDDGAIYYAGINEVMGMASMMNRYFPNMQSRLGDTFIGLEDGLAMWQVWNVNSLSPDFTEDNPGIEFDLLQIREGRIAHWTLFYELDFQELAGWCTRSRAETISLLLEDFGSAWSSGDPAQVTALYTRDAIMVDALFGNRMEGRHAIKAYAENFFAWYPGVEWLLIHSFSDNNQSDTHPDIGFGNVTGGVYAIRLVDTQGRSCDVLAAVLLENTDEGIIQERIYYNADSLISCGWAQ